MTDAEVVLVDGLPDGVSVVSVVHDGDHCYEVRVAGQPTTVVYAIRQVGVVLRALGIEIGHQPLDRSS